MRNNIKKSQQFYIMIVSLHKKLYIKQPLIGSREGAKLTPSPEPIEPPPEVTLDRARLDHIVKIRSTLPKLSQVELINFL